MHKSSVAKMKIYNTTFVLFIVLFVASCDGIDQANEPLEGEALLPQNDFVHSLPKLILPLGQDYSSVGHYSGYLRSSIVNTSMNYWFFKAKSDNWQTEPLILYLGGWVSSLNGALTGISPIKMHPNGSLTLNPHSWNRRANLLFIESFLQVGLLAENFRIISVDNDTIAAQFTFDIIESFFAKYPLLKENKFYLCGAGYSSFHVAILAKHLVDKQFPPNFKGILIGNRVFNLSDTMNAHFQYIYTMKLQNLYPTTIWNNLTSFCCSEKFCSDWSKDDDACSFRKCETFTNEKLYNDPPNGRIKNKYPNDDEKPLSNCHKFYNRFYTELLLIFSNKKVPRDLHNIRMKCAPGVRKATCTRYKVTKQISDFLNDSNTQVREALHINVSYNTYWIPGNELDNSFFERHYPTLHGHVMFLLSKNIRVLLYTGQLDGVVSPYNTNWFLNDLHLKPSEYGEEEWKFKSKTAGYRIRFCEGLSRYDIYGAGHTVAEDKPAETAQMVEDFLFGDYSDVNVVSPICSANGTAVSVRNFPIKELSPLFYAERDGYLEFWNYSFVRYFSRYFSYVNTNIT